MNDESDTTDSPKLPSTKRSVPIALIRAREKVMGPIREMLSDSGITEQQWRTLRVLDEFGAQDASTLADRACLLLPSQTRIVQTLLEKGLVSRQPDAKDRRKQTVAITPAGRDIIHERLDEAEAIASRIEEVIGKKKLNQLLDILEDFQKL
ncbi:homoprotocatechuate degradation operon regulator HpaR [Roseibium sp.]|uniref:homoprotocatechuate degradation operon regulator HpaR n=1 Tax=Roseibium sp. TaxID=1936156 RepID=UPI003BA99D81